MKKGDKALYNGNLYRIYEIKDYTVGLEQGGDDWPVFWVNKDRITVISIKEYYTQF
jgi:hypothetical protein